MPFIDFPMDEEIDARVHVELQKSAEMLAQLANKCGLDTSAIQQALEKTYRQWLQSERLYPPVWSGEFEGFSVDRVQELEAQKGDLLSCGYTDYEREGDWLILTYHSREYCYLEWGTGYCYPNAISWTKFLLFALQNVSTATLPYLGGYLLALLLPTAFFVWILKPGLRKYILLIDLLLIFPLGWLFTFSLIPFGLPFQSVGWLLLCYLLGRAVRLFVSKPIPQ